MATPVVVERDPRRCQSVLLIQPLEEERGEKTYPVFDSVPQYCDSVDRQPGRDPPAIEAYPCRLANAYRRRKEKSVAYNPERLYRVRGKLLTADHLTPVANCRVRLYDRDLLSDDFLGEADTDERGQFWVGFREKQFTSPLTAWAEGGPDLRVQVVGRPANAYTFSVPRSDRAEVDINLGPMAIVQAQPGPEDLAELGVFRVSGRVANAEGLPIAGLRLLFADRDLLRDDLIAYGHTDEQGRFECSFTRREFNRSLFEQEDAPDLYVQFFARERKEEAYRPIHRIDLDRKIVPGNTDLGELVIADFTDRPTFHPELAAEPAHADGGKVDVTPELLRAIVTEVAPLVRQYSDYDIDFENVPVTLLDHDDIAAIDASFLEIIGDLWNTIPGFVRRALVRSFMANGLAFYHFGTRSIHVLPRALRRMNLDALKVAIAHELVHAGQFQTRPELAAQLKQRHHDLLDKALGDPEPPDLVRCLREYVEWRLEDFGQDVEGEAAMVERKIATWHYPCHTYFPGGVGMLRGVVGRLVAWAQRKLHPDFQKMFLEQYTEGEKTKLAEEDLELVDTKCHLVGGNAGTGSGAAQGELEGLLRSLGWDGVLDDETGASA